MFANQRQEKIYELIKEKGNVKVEELVNSFNVSIETIRRDLILLEGQRNIKRVHGGAISISSARRQSRLAERIDENRQKKREISLVACELLQEGDLISIESGSTSLEFIELIKKKFNRLTILTNSLDIAERTRDKEGFNIFLTGGKYLKDENALYGDMAIKNIEQFCIPKAFIFPAGLTFEKGMSDYNYEFAQLQKAYIRVSEKKIIMVDSSKIGVDAFIRVSDIDSDFTIVTDAEADKEILDKFQEQGINVLTGVEREN